LLSTGKRTVIVLRIVGRDAATSATEAQLADDIFGANGDGLNLKTGYDRCSYGQLQIEPLTTNARIGPDGVYTVKLPNIIIAGKSRDAVYNAALAQATADLGVAPNFLANHVMFCIPPGTSGNWLAYSIPNHWMSVYNDKWCQYPSAQMHEIGKFMLPCIIQTAPRVVHIPLIRKCAGHNLNLHHSGEGVSAYGDQSGLMVSLANCCSQRGDDIECARILR
jgi:Gametolysin peptidase M11